MDTFVIGSGQQTLELRCTRRSTSGDAECLEVTYRDAGLSASIEVDAGYVGFEDLAEFFSELGYSWQGWTGDVVYESMDHNFVMSAQHDGVVRLSVDLVPKLPLEWHAHGEVSIQTGTELEAAVAGVEKLVGARLNA